MNRIPLLLFLGPALFVSCGGSSDPAPEAAEPPETLPVLVPTPTPGPEAVPVPGADAGTFADANFAPAPRGEATFRQERVFVEPMMMIEGVPTYDQGMGLKATQTPLDRYTFNYYRLDDDSLAFSVEATVLRDDPSQSVFSGAAIWYDPDLNATARGTFEGGVLHGEHQALDENGKVTKVTLYDKGTPYDPDRFKAAVHRPLVGTWHSDTDKGSSISRLVNVYTEDGKAQVQTIQLNKNSVLGGDDGLIEWSRTDPVKWSWKYGPRDETSGDAEYYEGNTLIAKSRLTFTGKDAFHARITFHRAPSMVGNEYTFRRRD